MILDILHITSCVFIIVSCILVNRAHELVARSQRTLLDAHEKLMQAESAYAMARALTETQGKKGGTISCKIRRK